MKFITALGLLFLTSGFVYAKNLDQCQEVRSQIEIGNRMINCESDEEGNITYLGISNFDGVMSEEEFEKIQSYDTIKEFTYGLFNDGDLSAISNNDHVFQYLNNLKNFKNLKKLHLIYDVYDNDCTTTDCTRHYLTNIETGTLKDLNLDLLDIYGINLSQDNIDEISTMENLDSIQLDICSFESVKDFSSLSNLKKVTVFSSIQNFNGKSANSVPVEFVYQFKNLKELFLDSSPSLDLKQFTDVENLWIGHEENISDLKDFKKLRSLKISTDNDLSVLEHIESLDGLDIYCYPPTYDYDEYPYQNINITFSDYSKITTLELQRIRVTDENVDELLKLKNLEYLYFLFCDLSLLSEENLNNLKELENRISVYFSSCNGVDETVIEYSTDYVTLTEYEEPTEYVDYVEPTDYIVETDYYTENDEPTNY